MEKLLKDFLKYYFTADFVSIDYFVINDHKCEIHYYTHESECYKEKFTVNLWEVLVYFNNKE